MDRFKFRFWRSDTGNWITSPQSEYTLGELDFEIRPNLIPMQCTGLRDKAGKLIYEGDILQVEIYEGMKLVVVWNETQWEMWSSPTSQNPYGNFCYLKEIIGNIYENPELIKGR